MSLTAIEGARLITPHEDIQRGRLIIERGKILRVGRSENIDLPKRAEIMQAEGLTLFPGFIDIHIHGAVGVRASDGVAAIHKICEYLPETGTTGWLPTVGSTDAMREVTLAAEGDCSGAEILGIHMEGPFLAPKNLPGTPEEKPVLPDLKMYEEMLEVGGDFFKIMGLAPELEGARELIREMYRTGVTAAAAHSRATYGELMQAVEVGLRHVTHAYNVMSGFHHRKPGVTGGMLTCRALTTELIGDGYHVSPAAIDILIRCKGVESIALITDCTSLAGMPDGVYGERRKEGGVIRRIGFSEDVDHTMAGSAWPLDHDFRNVKWAAGKSLREMAVMSSLVPARLAGVEGRKGTLEPGKDADLVALDRDLEVEFCMIGGEIAYSRR